MKKLFTYLLGFLMTFLSYACTDNNVEDAPAPAILELDHPSVNIAPDGGTTSVIVYSNYDWELSGGSSWCRPSTTSGKANTEGQEVSFSASSTYESRETTFWFSFADKKISLVVYQEQQDALIADGSNTFTIPAKGGTVVIEYKTNVDCQIVIPESAKNWLTVISTRSFDSKKATLKVTENTTYSARCAKIKVVSSDDRSLYTEYTINQEQNDEILVDGDNVKVPASGGSFDIDYLSNVDCEVIIPKDAQNWISIAPATRSLEAHSITFNVGHNNTFDARYAAISIKSESLSRDIQVEQSGIDKKLSLSQTEYELSFNEANIEVDVDSNIDYSIAIPKECDWVSINTQGNASKEKVVFNISENPTIYNREAVIVFQGEGLASELHIMQKGDEGVLSLNDEYTAQGKDTILKIEFQSNFEYKVSIPQDCDWVSIPGTRAAIEDHAIELTLLPNPTLDDRSVNIVFSDIKGDVSKSVKITQMGCELGELYQSANNEILYISTDGKKITPASATFGNVYILQNTYQNGIGKITYSGNITKFGDNVFKDCTTLKQIIIPSSVKEIGATAFYGCTDLISVTISDSVTSIGESAFCNCSSLSCISIPDKITVIGGGAFSGCDSLTRVDISDLSAWCNINFKNSNSNPLCQGGKLFINSVEATNITIPDNITSIRNYTFCGCGSITSITIPDDVTLIGDGAFNSCINLASITIPEGVTSIGGSAFSDCKSLTSVTIPDSVTSIGSYTFYGCSSLKSVTIPNSVTSIGGSAFSGCTGELIINSKIIEKDCTSYNYPMCNNGQWLYGSKFTGLIIGDNITKIGNHTFSDCKSLTSVTIPDSVTSIGESAFQFCSSLKSVTIPDSVTSIGVGAFFDCKSLTSVTIPDSVTSIGNYTFSNCRSLTSVTIPDSVTSIGDSAFYGCSSRTRVDISDLSAWCNIDFKNSNSNPLCQGGKLFINSVEATNITIPDNITSIRNYTFCGCGSITSITIPEGVTSIGSDTFYGCPNLTRVDISDLSAWYNIDFKNSNSNPLCQRGKLFINGVEATNITIPDNVTSIGNYAFCNCSSLTSVTIPNSVVNIGVEAFRGCNNITSTIIGLSVANIEDKAFYNCSKLNIVYCNALTPPQIGNDIFTYCAGDLQIYVLDYMVDSYKEAWGQYSSKILAGMSASDILPTIYYTTLDNKPIDVNIENINTHTYDENGGKITINSSVITTIPKKAFFNCNTLTSVTIPDTVTSIGASAFYGCSSLKSVTIPDTVTSIGASAFYDCKSLTSVTIPDSVTSIGSYTFSGCSKLKDVYCKPKTPPTGMSMFAIYACGLKIYVPRNSVEAYKSASYWSNYSSNIEGYDF